jgi:hypothetical protein
MITPRQELRQQLIQQERRGSLHAIRLFVIFGEHQVMAQLIATRVLISPLMNKDFSVRHPLPARGNFASMNLNHQKCRRVHILYTSAEWSRPCLENIRLTSIQSRTAHRRRSQYIRTKMCKSNRFCWSNTVGFIPHRRKQCSDAVCGAAPLEGPIRLQALRHDRPQLQERGGVHGLHVHASPPVLWPIRLPPPLYPAGTPDLRIAHTGGWLTIQVN